MAPEDYSLRKQMAQVLPLRVTGYAITETFFNVYGAGWSLAINCDWSLSRHGLSVATWMDDDDRIGQAIAMLTGRSIIAITVDDDLIDPLITFDDGAELFVRADTDLDPWVLRAEGLPVIFVGRRAPAANGASPGLESSYEATVPRDLPHAIDHVYRSDSGGSSQLGLPVTIRLADGGGWNGQFFAPRSSRRAVTGIYRTAQAMGLCVIHQGHVFVGDVLDPASIAPVDDLAEVVAVERDATTGLLYLSLGQAVAAIDAGGLVWLTTRLAIEELSFDGVEEGSLLGVADPSTAGSKPFAIDVITGDVRGGATGLR